MVFVSQIFLFWFLPAVLLVYYLLPARARSVFLTLASYVFYGWWRPDFVLLMIATTSVDYLAGGLIARLGAEAAAAPGEELRARLLRRRKACLVSALTANLGLLAYFKYVNFGIETLNAVLASAGLAQVSWPQVVLPIGISFYTFHSMSYTIDIYRGETTPAPRFIDFACFVSLFPQLVAGPILRYRNLADQLQERTHTLAKLGTGALLFQMGFAKKVLLADNIGPLADAAYRLESPTAAEAWLGTLAYAYQIYFDFSGYSDMAIGLGLMLGFVLLPNFDAPYKSRGVADFWRRWHISLSTWLRDYLYIPLGGNRKGPGRTYVNLLITMLLGGLWHGAAWTFVAWGAYHGSWLALARARPAWMRDRLPPAMQSAVTFAGVLGSWVLFRSASLSQAGSFYRAMAGLGTSGIGGFPALDTPALAMLALAASALIAHLASTSQSILERGDRVVELAVPLLFLLAVLHLFWNSYSPFLYFQF